MANADTTNSSYAPFYTLFSTTNIRARGRGNSRIADSYARQGAQLRPFLLECSRRGKPLAIARLPVHATCRYSTDDSGDPEISFSQQTHQKTPRRKEGSRQPPPLMGHLVDPKCDPARPNRPAYGIHQKRNRHATTPFQWGPSPTKN